jgi:hypothetical protein
MNALILFFMKTSLKIMFILVLISGVITDLKSQQYPCTVIDVRGSRYGDSMWLFTVAGTTDGFDNGWDGFKMFGSSLAPQIFAVGSDLKNYQVYTSSNIHGANISFRKGEDSQYTLYFKHYDLSLGYQQLYLLDKKNMVITDIYAVGSQYSFSCESGDAEERFRVLAYLESNGSSEGSGQSDTTTEEGGIVNNDGSGVEDSNDNYSSDNNEESVPDGSSSGSKDKKGKPEKAKDKSFRVFAVEGNVVVDNLAELNAEVVIIDARTGVVIKRDFVAGKKITILNTNLKKGAYIVNISIGTEQSGTTIIL